MHAQVTQQSTVYQVMLILLFINQTLLFDLVH